MTTVKRRKATDRVAMSETIRVLLEDNHLLAVFKPAGLLAQGDRTGDPTALEQARQYLKEKYRRPGNVFLGLVHRLDRPVSGVMVFARTSKAASRLARAFHDRRVEKTYLVVTVGSWEEQSGDLSAFIERTHMRSRLATGPSPRSKEAVLGYRVLATRDGRAHPDARESLLEVVPRTGRHHQIRLQLSAAGHPIVGDIKYRAPRVLPSRAIALHAARLRVPHPVRDEIVSIAAPPPDVEPWSHFAATIDRYFDA
jgi:23S rRNA pseudouridine1911/1915/1917 synthase